MRLGWQSKVARAAFLGSVGIYKRTYPSGRVVWIARYYDLDGVARYAKPEW